MGAWYDNRTKQEVMNLLILKQLQQAVGSFGLTGLDKLLSFMIVKELQVCLSNGLNRRDVLDHIPKSREKTRVEIATRSEIFLTGLEVYDISVSPQSKCLKLRRRRRKKS